MAAMVMATAMAINNTDSILSPTPLASRFDLNIYRDAAESKNETQARCKLTPTETCAIQPVLATAQPHRRAIEGDPFARNGAREYLFGLVVVQRDHALRRMSRWAHSDSEERIAFERAVDEILRSWASNPVMHVYHHAPHEPAGVQTHDATSRYA